MNITTMNMDKFYECEGLTDYEKETLLPILIDYLETRRGKENAVTNSAMRRLLQILGYSKVGEPRIRKIINVIRINGYVECLLANSDGYYSSDDIQEVEEYIQSLRRREMAIRAVREQIEIQLKKLLVS